MDTDSPARPHRARRLLLGLLVLLLLGAGVVALWAPRWAAARVGDALTAAARGRGFEVSWDAIEVAYSGEIVVSGLAFHSLRGGRLEGEIARLETRVTWSQAWHGERPHRARLEGVRVRADLPGLAASRGDVEPQAAEPPTEVATDAEGFALDVQRLDLVVELDEERTVACRVDTASATLGAAPRLEAEMACRAPDPGLETGRFRLDARLSPEQVEEPLQVVLEPEAAFHAEVAGASFGRVSASLGPNGGRIEVAALALAPQGAGDDWPMYPRELGLDELLIELARDDGGLAVRRVEAGPGRLVLERPGAAVDEEAGGGDASGEATAAETREDEDDAVLPLEEAADHARGGGASRADWTAIEARLADWTARASEAMGRATSLTDEIAVHDIAVSLELGAGAPIAGRVLAATAVPGRAEVTAELDGHPVHLDIANVPDSHAMTLDLRAEELSLDDTSRLLGREGLFAGQLDAHVVLTANDGLEVDWTLDSPDLTFFHPAVSPQPLALLPVHLEGELRFAPGTRDRLLIDGRGSLGDDVRGQIGVQVRDDDGETRLDADFEVEETDCADLLAAIPEGLFVHMARSEIRVAGRAGLDGDVRYIFGSPRSFRLRFGEQFPGTCEILQMPRGYRPEVLLDPGYVHDVPAEFLTEEADPVRVGPGTASWVPLEELPPWVGPSMYFSEQKLFYEEPALSVRLINRAVRVNLMYGRWAYGGSTITQQLVKNLFLDRTKTLARKLEEAIISWAVFSALTPDQILALYVNCIEFGPDVWGIQAAAHYYFGIDARELTPVQSVFLAGLKPSPESGGPYRRRGQSPSRQRWRDRIRDRLTELAEAGYIDVAYVEAQAPYIVTFPEEGANDGGDEDAERPAIAPFD